MFRKAPNLTKHFNPHLVKQLNAVPFWKKIYQLECLTKLYKYSFAKLVFIFHGSMCAKFLPHTSSGLSFVFQLSHIFLFNNYTDYINSIIFIGQNILLRCVASLLDVSLKLSDKMQQQLIVISQF